MLESTYIQLNNCVKLNALCRDPPATTSAILRNLGLSDYDVRSFWNFVKHRIRNKSHTITVFRHRNVSFKAELDFRSGSSCFVPPSAFLDEFECQEFEEAKQITNLNMLYVYLKGYAGDELFIKVNVVYLLKKLVDLGEACAVNSIRRIVKKLLDGSLSFDGLTYVDDLANTLLRFNRELSELMVYVPKNNAEFLRSVPLLTGRIRRKRK